MLCHCACKHVRLSCVLNKLLTYLLISQTIQDIAIVTMEGEYELVCDLSNDATSNDIERTLTPFSRSHHSLTLNIIQTATDTAIVTIEGEYKTTPKLSNGTNFNDLE